MSSQIENWLAVDFQTQVAMFAKEEVAMTWGGNWNQLTIDRINPNIEIGFMPVPISEDAASNDFLLGFAQYWCVNKNSPTKKEAKEFLNWLSSTTEGQGFLTKDMKLIPAFTTFKADPDVGVLGREFGDYLTQGKVKPIYVAYYPDGGRQVFGEEVQKLIAGQATVDQYLEALESGWKRLSE
jgi:raffinose/stachyose/melibiose transport system substrate-binding protein